MGKSITQSLEDGANANNKLSSNKIAQGLREALEIGTKKVVGQLGVQNGFNLDPKIHIPLPKTLARVDSALSAIGMNGLTDDLELRINRAAEIATPKAKALFITAIKQMTIKDARQILSGPQDAATQYLRRTMGAGLEKEMQPLVQQALASAGAFKAYDSVIGRYDQIPFMPDIKADINNYVIEKAMDGIFYYVGQEETAIRTNPAKRTTELLKAVFSSQ
ncbi:MAG: hypothetical protein COB36_03210 [Alphaproteobacteria bacterium]|nr:MAG: hypothetical protein COB36_03210 [Alphaproteobacteria bacterium]